MDKNISVGQRFGRWQVIELVERPDHISKKKSTLFFKCKCDCGTIKILYKSDIRSGKTKSCGCARTERIVAYSTKYAADIRYGATIFKRYKDADLTLENFLQLSKLNCYYCDSPPEQTYENYVYNGLDRIDSTLPHTKDNCVPCCWKCNTAKLSYSTEEFKKWVRDVYNCLILNKKWPK